MGLEEVGLSDRAGKIILGVSVLILLAVLFLAIDAYKGFNYKCKPLDPCTDATSKVSLDKRLTCMGENYTKINLQRTKGGYFVLKDVMVIAYNSQGQSVFRINSEDYYTQGGELVIEEDSKTFQLDESYYRVKIAPVLSVGSVEKTCPVSSSIEEVRSCYE
jgi:hypothetical protein